MQLSDWILNISNEIVFGWMLYINVDSSNCLAITWVIVDPDMLSLCHNEFM